MHAPRCWLPRKSWRLERNQCHSLFNLVYLPLQTNIQRIPLASSVGFFAYSLRNLLLIRLIRRNAYEFRQRLDFPHPLTFPAIQSPEPEVVSASQCPSSRGLSTNTYEHKGEPYVPIYAIEPSLVSVDLQ